jgi:hypothetical protein
MAAVNSFEVPAAYSGGGFTNFTGYGGVAPASTSASVSTSGVWSTDANAGHSGSTAKYTTAAGASMTLTLPATTQARAVYAVVYTKPGGSPFAVTVSQDAGVTNIDQGGGFTCYNTNVLGNTHYSVLQPLSRFLDLTATGSTVITITASTWGGAVYVGIESFIVITGPAATKGTPLVTAAPTAKLPGGVGYVALGDGWTYGNGGQLVAGVAYAPGGWAARASQMLQQRLARPVAFTRKGVPGDALFATTRASAGDSILAGGMYRLFSDVLPAQPAYVSVQFGLNDLVTQGCGAGDYLRHIYAMMAFLTDCMDTTQVQVVFCTPGWITALAAQTPYAPANATVTTSAFPGPIKDTLESVAQGMHALIGMFPWFTLARLLDAMDYKDSLLLPNSTNDLGGRPNDLGHGVIAVEVARALLRAAGSAGD